MRICNFFKIGIAAVLCAAIINPAYATSYQQSYKNASSQLEAQLEALNKINQEAYELRTEIHSLTYERESLNADMYKANAQLTEFNYRFSLSQQFIGDQMSSVSELIGVSRSFENLYLNQTQAMSSLGLNHEPVYLTPIYCVSGTFHPDLNSRIKFNNLTRFKHYNNTKIKKANELIDEMAHSQESLRQTINLLDSETNKLQNQISYYDMQIESLENSLNDVTAKQALQEIATSEAKVAWDNIIDEIENYIRNMLDRQSSGTLFGFDFQQPLDSYTYISTNFADVDPWHSNPHGGVDFAAGAGTPIYAVESGIVSIAQPSPSYGNYVMINHGNAPDGNSYATLYAHMLYYCVQEGQTVSRGQIIGYVGSTGRSTGNHLHLELRQNKAKIDPLIYIPH